MNLPNDPPKKSPSQKGCAAGPDGRDWLSPEEQELRRQRFYAMVQRHFSGTAVPEASPRKPAAPANRFVMVNEDGDEVGPTAQRIAHALNDDGEVLGHQIDIRDRDITWQAFSLRDTVLGKLHYRKKPVITLQHLMAGEKFYTVARYAGFVPSLSADAARVIVDGGEIKNEADRTVAAREVYWRLHKAMHPNHWHIVEALSVQGIGLAEYAERFRRIYTGGEMMEVKKRQDRQLIAAERLRSGLDWLIARFGIGHKGKGIVASRGETASVMTRSGHVEQRLSARKERVT